MGTILTHSLLIAAVVFVAGEPSTPADSVAAIEEPGVKVVDQRRSRKPVIEVMLYAGDTGDQELERLQALADIRSLAVLDAKEVMDDWLKRLAGLSALEDLQIHDSNITEVTDIGLKHLRGLTKLRSLTLGDTKVTDAGLVHLREMTKLDRLFLASTGVTNAGLESLRGLKELRDLGLGNTKVTQDGVNQLKSALPRCDVDWYPR